MFDPARRLLLAFLLLAIVSVAQDAFAQDDQSRVFRAGAATSNISPRLGEPIVGGWSSPPAASIHDELYARCLVLDDGSTQLAFVICDNVGIPREVFDQARRYVGDETDLEPMNVLMAATHTHSATSARGTSKVAADPVLSDYQAFLARRIADGVRRALHNLAPAEIGWGSVDEPSEVFNRRWYVKDEDLLRNPFGGVDQVRMNPPRGSGALDRPAGPIDPEVSFISVRSREGRPIALLANYSLHYVGGVPAQEVSADYFGVFARQVEEMLGARDQSPPFVGMMTNGTSGDINNINFRNTDGRRAPYERIEEVGTLIAKRVVEAAEAIHYQNWVPLAVAHEELVLQVRKPDEDMTRYFEKIAQRPEGEAKYHQHEDTYASRVKTLAEGPDEVKIILQVFKIGDLSIAAIPFEVFAEIGLDIKKRTPFKDAFVIELANGSYGYLPTPAQHKLGGYETWMGTNNVQLDASDKITEVVLRLMHDLRDGERGSSAH